MYLVVSAAAAALMKLKGLDTLTHDAVEIRRHDTLTRVPRNRLRPVNSELVRRSWNSQQIFINHGNNFPNLRAA
jgi:hypothetical protein